MSRSNSSDTASRVPISAIQLFFLQGDIFTLHYKVVFAVLGIEPRAFHEQGKCSTTGLHSLAPLGSI